MKLETKPMAIKTPTLFLSDDDVTALADWPHAVRTLAAAYAQEVEDGNVPPRSMARGEGIWLRSLTAVAPGGYMGCKLIAASMRGRRASYLVSLFDTDTMELIALIDGNQITGLRTAATSAVAIDVMAPRRALKVGILGSGFEARGQLHALAATRDIEAVSVYSPNPASRGAFVAHFPNLAGKLVAALSPQGAVQSADVVICAARARGEAPVLLGNWLSRGATVVSIGSTLPEQRELDISVLERATLVVADMPEEVLHDTGDMIAAQAAGLPVAERTVSLADLICGKVVARAHPDDIVVYKSVGSALQDVVLAAALLERARALGRGTVMPTSIRPVAK